MRKKVKQEVEVEISICNICKQEITSEPHNKKRIEIVRFLFSVKDFDAHEGCVNKIVKKAFWPYVSEEVSKAANKA